MEFSIIMLTYNRGSALRSNLQRVIDLTPRHRAEIIVINNQSTDNTADYLAKMPVKVVTSPVNYGVWSRNIGIKEAQGKIIVNIDDDVSISDANYLDVIASAMTDDVGGVGQDAFYGCEDFANAAKFEKSGAKWVREGQYADCITGFCWAFRNENFYFNDYWKYPAAFWFEEYEIQLQIRDRGYRLRRIKNIAVHGHSGNRPGWEKQHNESMAFVRAKWKEKSKMMEWAKELN